MKYIIDTNSLTAIFRHYYFERFPSFWEKFNELINNNSIVSVREARREIEELRRSDTLEMWTKENTYFFADPTNEELSFITEIYSIQHFRYNLEKRKLLKGGAFADPFIIAKANNYSATVVTQEANKKNSAKIPNICEHFEIDCINLEGLLVNENWEF